MRFMSTGDDHIKEGARWLECIRIHDWIAGEVEKEKPDAFMDGGDIYDALSTPTEREYASGWLQRIAEVCPVIITKGNHDRELDCAILGKLRAKHKITVEEACGVHMVGGIAVAAVAWPSLGNLAAMMGRPVNSTVLDDVARAELSKVFLGLGSALDLMDAPKLLLGHFMVDGSMTSLGQPLIGAQLNISLTELSLARAQMVLMSHIHKPQEWTFNDAPIAYMGSPYATAFGETETKSIILGDVTQAGISWTRRPTPRTPMVLVEAGWDPEWPGWVWSNEDDRHILELGGAGGAEIRFRYHVRADLREQVKLEAAAVKARWLEGGAVSVKVEEVVIPQVRSRTPEIATASSLAEKSRLVWKAKGIDVSPERDARLMTKLSALQEGQRNAH